MFTMPKKPQNCFGVLLTSLQFWKTHYKQLLLTVLASIILGAIPGLIFPKINVTTYSTVLTIILKYWWCLPIFLIVMFFLFGFVLHRVYCIINKKDEPIIHSLFVALKKLPYLIIAYFIYVIVVSAGLLVFIIPGIGFLILLSMYFPLIVVEDKGPISAFKRSWDLTTKAWWHTFFVFLILTTVIILASIFIHRISDDLWLLAHPMGGTLPIVHRLLKFVLDMIFFPLYVTSIMILLEDLRLRQQLEEKLLIK